MELYIFDRDLTFIGLLNTPTSFQYTRRYSKCGDFELHCPLTSETVFLLAKENIIWKKGDVEAVYIEFRQMDQDDEGRELLVVKGKTLSGYINRRIIWSQNILQTTGEKAIRTIVSENCIVPSDTKRIIPSLILGPLKGLPKTVDYQVSYTNLMDEVEGLCSLCDLGYRVIFEPIDKKLIFEVYEGLNRTYDQDINPRCVFSKEFDNILTQTYTDSINNYRNTALVGGMGDGSDRIFTSIGTSEGLDRFESFVDAKDLSDKVDDDYVSEADYLNMLIDRGNSKLSENQEVQTFDNVVNLDSNLVYKRDFNLGDMVVCMSKKWGLTLNTRITEITEIYEENSESINVVFGINIPTIIDKIKSLGKQQQYAASSSSGGGSSTDNIDGGSFI